MDDNKNNIMIAVLAFNVVVILFMGYMYFTATEEAPFSNWNFLWALLLGTVAGGAAFGAASMKK